LTFTVRRLDGADVAIYREIRLEGLRTDPASFGASLEEDRAVTDEGWRTRLEKNPAYGVFDGDWLVGIAGYYVETGEKTKHRAHLVGVYVRQEARGTEAGRLLLEAVIASARQNVTFLYLQVTQDNTRAVRFYERAGFTVYGRDPGGLFVDGTMHQDYLMMLRFD
jgi:ribosomal protein S18 acetylase RimI-like enzyme